MLRKCIGDFEGKIWKDAEKERKKKLVEALDVWNQKEGFPGKPSKKE